MWQTWTLRDWIVAGAGFLLVLSVWMMGLLLWNLRRRADEGRLQKRLGLGRGQEPARVLRLWRDGEESTTLVPDRDRRPLMMRLEELREAAGWKTPVTVTLAGLSTGVVAAFLILMLITDNPLLGLAAGVGILCIFWIVLQQRIAREVARFETQLVDGMELAARSLRAGHPLISAFRIISEEIPAPLGTLFLKICEQQQLGVSLEDAIREAAKACRNKDMAIFSTAIVIQLRSGGNLADMMERLSEVIRERMRINRRARVLTAQTQFSKRLLLALPVLLFVVINLLNPAYMRPLYTTPTGKAMLGTAVAGLVLGAWVMNRMARLKF